MKKLISLMLVLVLMFTFAACGGGSEDGGNKEEETTVPAKVSETENIVLDGIYVDESYVDDESEELKMVYVFFTVKATNENLKIDSKYTDIVFGGTNTYSSDFYKGSCVYMPTYYYSSYIEDVYVGTETKLALTFKVPQGEFVSGKEITFADSSLPVSELKVTTDDMIISKDAQTIGERVDPDGCAKEVYAREDADEATVKKVREQINGYYFTFYVSVGSTLSEYELEFYAPDKFEVRVNTYGGIGNEGYYEVKNGYIFITYTSNDHTVEIPYDFDENGEISLYCSEAFSIYE